MSTARRVAAVRAVARRMLTALVVPALQVMLVADAPAGQPSPITSYVPIAPDTLKVPPGRDQRELHRP